MSDRFQTLVFADLSEQEAPSSANRIIQWLIEVGVLAAETSDCIISDEPGYPPGPEAEHVVESKVGENFRELQTNGLEVEIGRRAFPALDGGLEPVACPDCGAERSADDDWMAAVDDWDAGGDGVVACAQCGEACSVARWKTSPYWGFGSLGLTFWNWPPLKASFLDQLAKLSGSQIVLVDGFL